jgi:AAA+ ATPase superfamily predicted ATPase
MRRIEFHDREKEIKDIKDIFEREPSLITFIYGPINSGKTELISYLVRQLRGEYVVFYINLRAKFLASYEEFVEALFEIELEGAKRKETLKELVSSITKVAGIPITEKFIEYVFKDKKPKNAFSYMVKLFEEVRDAGKQPVLIVDELQKIGDVEIEGSLIYELFNFFIDLTKELHLCHVFAVSSDSLFIEKIYSDAMLQGRCEYLLVDDFDYKETMLFLEKYGFSEGEKEKVWEYCGGKPVYLVDVINAKISGKEIKEKVENLLETRKSQILSIFDDIALKRVDVSEEAIIKEFSVFEAEEEVRYKRLNNAKIFLVKKNVLFVDPTRRTIRPQSKLDLLAMREVVKEGA